MSTTTALPRPTQALTASASPSGAAVSRGFDLAFFVLPPLGTVAFLLTQHLVPQAAFAIACLAWVVLAQSHFGATAIFYLDPASLAHYRRSPLTYFAVPAALILGYAALGLTPWAGAALALVPVASFWHGNRQSVGIGGLYRRLSGSFDAGTRRLEQAAIFSGSACFTGVGIVRLGMAADFGLSAATLPALVITAWWALLARSMILLVAAEARAYGQARQAGISPWMRMCVLFSSWAMYFPYLVAADPMSAFLASLVPHYLQYHGLLYLVNHNKIAAGLVAEPSALAHVARRPAGYAAATVGFGLVLGLIVVASHRLGAAGFGLAVVAGINMAHFWLDGFFWRFRDPQAREATLRHIRPLSA